MAKADQQTADRIRKEARFWPNRVLAKRFGLSERSISLIVSGRTHAAG